MAGSADVTRLLEEVRSQDPTRRQEIAAQLSKVAAKADGARHASPAAAELTGVRPTGRAADARATDADPVLIQLSDESEGFIDWLSVDEPLVRAYTACILANVAFLEAGQKRVSAAPPLRRTCRRTSSPPRATTSKRTCRASLPRRCSRRAAWRRWCVCSRTGTTRR